MAIALVLKTSVRKDLRVRIPHPPPSLQNQSPNDSKSPSRSDGYGFHPAKLRCPDLLIITVAALLT
jgi:hypothetical protein